MESIQKNSKLLPGVGKYNPDMRPKVLGNYLQKVKIGGFTDDAMFKGMQTPAAYSPVDLSIYKPRSTFTKIMKPLKPNPENESGTKLK